MRTTFPNAVLEVLCGGSKFQEEGGSPFEAVTQTDLMSALRDRGFRLPAAGFLMNELEALGFKTRQAYQFKGTVRRVFGDGTAGRALSKYQTIIYL